jgi:Myb/SANT-like DNA-binding domain
MARKKDKPGTDNTMSTRCSWSASDDAIMVRVLREQKDAGNQSGSGWKKTVWNLVAETLEKEGIPNGPSKTATKCSDHYSNVSNVHYLLLRH